MEKPRIRCSSLDRRLVCPGSHLLEERVGGSESGQAAFAGNWAHWVAATTLVDHHDAIPPEGGVPLPELPEGFQGSGYHGWMADFFVKEMLARTSGMALLVEDELEWEFDDFILTGHIDAYGITGDGLEADGGDLKTGGIPVDIASCNNQVLGYLVLLALNYERLQVARFAIIQPANNPEDGHERVSEVFIEGRERLMEAATWLESEIRRALGADQNLVCSDGGKQCTYCPAFEQCPATTKERQIMKALLTPEFLETVQSEAPTETLVEIEMFRSKFSQPMDRVRDALKDRATEAGGTLALPDGRRVVVREKNGGRFFTDKLAAMDRMEAEGLNRADVIENVVTLKVTPLVDMLAEHRKVPKSGKAEVTGQKLFAELFGDLIEQRTNKHLVIQMAGEDE